MMRREHRLAVPANPAGCHRPRRPRSLTPFHHAGHRNPEPRCDHATTRSRSKARNCTLPKIHRISPRHHQPPSAPQKGTTKPTERESPAIHSKTEPLWPHRSDGGASRRNIASSRQRCTGAADPLSSGLACRGGACRTRQHHTPAAAAQMPRVELRRKRLAVPARQLALKLHFHILRRLCRPLLPRLEQVHRATTAHYLFRLAPIGASVRSMRIGIPPTRATIASIPQAMPVCSKPGLHWLGIRLIESVGPRPVHREARLY